MSRSLIVVLITILLAASSAVHAEKFPHPIALEQDVNFWVRVYTEINTRSGFIHDSRNLAVVYATVRVDGSRRANRHKIKKEKAHYAGILKKLAKGKRDNLNADEKRVLAAWGSNVSNKRLRQAANDIRFQLGQSNRFREGLIRSGEWRPYIDQTLKDLQMPLELAALPHVESSFNPEAYSRVGAAGIWQFIRSTGKRYMQIDYVVDERMDPFASTVAAAKLLRHNYSITDSWPLALTAYNHGVASMRRAINKLGTRDITTIVRNYKGRAFGFASRNFYVAFLAALKIDRNPKKYFGDLNISKPYQYEVVKTKEYLPAKSVATTFNVSIDTLRLHNRALLEPVWSGSKRIPKGFKLRVPKGTLSQPAYELLAAIPANERFSKQTADAFHKVVRGDTLSEISVRYGHSIREIRALNGLGNRSFIRVGQVLRLPVKGQVLIASAEPVVPKKKVVAAPTKSKRVPSPEPIIIAKAPLPSEPQKDSSSFLTSQSTPSETDNNVADVEDIQQKQPKPILEQSELPESEKKEPEVAITQVAKETEIVENIPAIEELPDQISESENGDVESVAEPKLETAEHATLLTDPSDYTVTDDETIEVQASETLGHYAEWLDLRASRLRKINGMRFGKPVVIGRRIKLDFSRVSRDEFEHRRVTYQQNLQEEFFTLYRIDSTRRHVIKRGESLWVLALRKFKVPVWLLRQHNPDVDFDKIRPGTEITVPVLLEVPPVNGNSSSA